jgi:hypothetical protein
MEQLLQPCQEVFRQKRLATCSTYRCRHDYVHDIHAETQYGAGARHDSSAWQRNYSEDPPEDAGSGDPEEDGTRTTDEP